MSRYIKAVGKIGPAFNGAILTISMGFTASTTSSQVGPEIYSYDTYTAANRAVAYFTDER